MPRLRAASISTITLLCSLGAAGRAHAQSLLDRPPNLSANWVGVPGTIYFNFLHRFSTSNPPERKVSNVPTFLVAAGTPWRTMLGLNYSTNSSLTPRFPNEWELFVRWQPWSQDVERPFDIGAHLAYNNASEGIDGELSIARRFGRLRLIGAGRVLSDPSVGGVQPAAGAGATLRVGNYVALAADVSRLLDGDSTRRMGWSAGVQMGIPFTPHSLSLHATNTTTTTLQGMTRGTPDIRYGFEFTIPFTIRRYTQRNDIPPVVTAPPVVVPPPDTISRLHAVIDSLQGVVARIPPADRPGAAADSVRGRADAVTRADSLRAAAAVRADSLARADSVARARAADSARAAARTPPTRPAPRVVRTGMRNMNYTNTRLEITVGTTVRWTNNDQVPHTVTSTDKQFDSGLIGTGTTWEYTFTRPGTYNFYCLPHPFMKGVIVVRAR